ncbi:hypothetical protein A4G20_00530 [Pasteurellaceae bacterium RH1A]|nr:hypothetical protein A4G20_00530 [Pasteurellaceae bacterium RH1A]
MKKRYLIVIFLLGLGLFFQLAFEVFPQPKSAFKQRQQAVYFPQNLANSGWQCFTTHQAPVQPLTQIRLLNWNIHKGMDEGWQADLSQLAQGQDLVLLQEASTSQQIPELLPQFASSLHNIAFEYLNEGAGVLSLSRWQPSRYCQHAEAEPWIRLPKTLSALTIPTTKQALLVVNVHFVNFEWFPTAYQAQLEALRELISVHSGPVILAGDFNAWRGERTQLLQAMVGQLGLKEVPLSSDERLQVFGYPLDYLFVRGLALKSATSFQVSSSDHNPLMATFHLED